MFGPAAAGVGAAIEGVTSATDALYLDHTSGGLPKTLSASFRKSVDAIGDQMKKRKDLLESQLNEIDHLTNKHLMTMPNDNSLKDVDRYIKGMLSDLKKMKKNGDDTHDLRVDLKRQLESKRKMLQLYEPATKAQADKIEKLFQRIGNIISIEEIAVEQFNRIRNNQEQIEAVADVIQTLETDLVTLRKHEDLIYDTMIPSVREMENVMSNVSANAGKSILEQSMSSWKVQNMLRDTKTLVQKMTKDFEDVGSELRGSIEKLEHALAFVADVYDRIDSYAEQKAFSTLVGSIATGASQFQDSRINAAVTQLEQVTKSNIILERFGIVMQSFQQHYFPFAHSFLETFRLPDNTTMLDACIVEQNAYKIIDLLISQTQSWKSLIGSYDKYITVERDVTFYTWPNSRIKNETTQLLQGKTIIINADISKANLTMDAVKFKEIGIQFKLHNQSKQSIFDAELQPFTLNLTMFGNNYYRCGNRFYYTPSNADISIQRKFKTIDGKPISQNSVHQKIVANDYFLSPYTTWSIKLIGDFTKLQQFQNDAIDLKLTGNAQFLNQFLPEICNENLNKYYQRDDTVTIN